MKGTSVTHTHPFSTHSHRNATLSSATRQNVDNDFTHHAASDDIRLTRRHKMTTSTMVTDSVFHRQPITSPYPASSTFRTRRLFGTSSARAGSIDSQLQQTPPDNIFPVFNDNSAISQNDTERQHLGCNTAVMSSSDPLPYPNQNTLTTSDAMLARTQGCLSSPEFTYTTTYLDNNDKHGAAGDNIVRTSSWKELGGFYERYSAEHELFKEECMEGTNDLNASCSRGKHLEKRSSDNIYASCNIVNRANYSTEDNVSIDKTLCENNQDDDNVDEDDGVFQYTDLAVSGHDLQYSTTSVMSSLRPNRFTKTLEDVVLNADVLRSSRTFLSLLRHHGGGKGWESPEEEGVSDSLDLTLVGMQNKNVVGSGDYSVGCRRGCCDDDDMSSQSGHGGSVDSCCCRGDGRSRNYARESSSSESSSFDSSSMGSGVSMLCAERVNQMTKTYNDIEAVSRLLEEKERDLELAARIGQTLLAKNKELAVKNECLDEQLTFANDRVSQLRHDLSLKEELLRFYNENLEENESRDTSPAEPSEESLVNMDFLQKKVNTLEDENLNLRLESSNLKTTTASYEDKEKRLVEDCIKQLAEVNCQVETFAQELQHKAEENESQKDQIGKFLSQTADLQVKIRKLTVDNMELHDNLTLSTDSQRKLTKELGRMQDKYDELYEMLEEAQVELQVMRGKRGSRANTSDRNHHHNAYDMPTDSLASELETSLQQELAESNRRAQSWKIFETARAAKRAVAKVGNQQLRRNLHQSFGSSSVASSVRSMPALNSSAPALRARHDSDAVSFGYSAYTSDGESMTSDGYTADMDSLYGSNQELGRPGIPGSNDLESALRRLALKRDNSDRGEVEAEEAARRMGRGRSPTSATPRMPSPGGMSTASSCLSIPGSGYSPSHSAGAATLKSSDKLKIMKPLEGSVTLRHWQHLANPHLGGIFESRTGVQLKGERRLELDEEVVYCLSDYEEDPDMGGQLKDGTPSTLVHSLIDAAVRTPGVDRDWVGLQDPRTPSPGMTFYNHHSSTTALTPSGFHNNNHPMQTSTPVMQSAFSTSNLASASISNNNNNNNRDTCPGSGAGMSLGLAALLDSSDVVCGGHRKNPVNLRGSVMRAALPISKSKTPSAASSSSKNQNNFNNLLSSLSTAAFTSTLSSASSNLSSASSATSSSSDSGKMGTNYSSRGSGGDNGAAISSGVSSGSSTPRSSSILMTTQNLLQRYKSLPGSRPLDDAPGSNSNVKVTGAGNSSNVSSLLSSTVVSTNSLSLPISSVSSSSIAAAMTTANTTAGDKNSWVFSPSMTGQGFLQQLKNRGFSLYGLWANASAAASAKMSGTEEQPSSSIPSSLSSASNRNSSSISSTAILSNASLTVDRSNAASDNRNNNSNSSINASLLGLNLLPRHPSSPIDLESEELLNSPTTATTTTVSTVPGSGGGVFGTYAGFRHGKML